MRRHYRMMLAGVIAGAASIGFAAQTLVENFEGATAEGAVAMFEAPDYSGSTDMFVTAPNSAGAALTVGNTYLDPAVGSPGTKSCHISWTWASGASGTPWLRLTTDGSGHANPTVDLNQGLGFYIKVVKGAVGVGVGVRDASSATTIGTSGGNSGGLKVTPDDKCVVINSAQSSDWQYIFIGPTLKTAYGDVGAGWTSLSGASPSLVNNFGTLESLKFIPVGSATAIELYVDDFYQGPKQNRNLAAVSDWSMY